MNFATCINLQLVYDARICLLFSLENSQSLHILSSLKESIETWDVVFQHFHGKVPQLIQLVRPFGMRDFVV